ncbi:MAG TPA: ferritin-like domain-containing protein [Phycisphaerae bacterium]|nr:ferritin-like domain-containing protein [Phycisphaerae bacterium]HOJ74202.1 ferritin-like domain-containing protein [Phycisphaerae bacterium]HOM51280.1 ferritin-like domain-containing protein [Phycisphaerae bacterium]HON65847.1 ferritin-like domain-containing protein [Phycisphaerae bacterium]HOQ84892.1 ferritin-like domain-containing protein [Phycisphaerae bacterium]
MDNKKSIELLNKAVADELHAVHQYMYWHFHLDDQGFGPLSALLRRVAIVEMGHVERLAERILFLKGDVDMVPAGSVERITEPAEIINRAAAMEQDAVRMYNQFALEAGQNADSATKQIFESLVIDEETHFDEFDKQADNIKRFGPSYLVLQSFNKGAEEGGESAD